MVVPEGDWGVRGNDSLLHSAVENVVRNAIRYTQEGTSVQIELSSEEKAGRREGGAQRERRWAGEFLRCAGETVCQPFYRAG